MVSNSRYIFASPPNSRIYGAVAEVRDYPDESNNCTWLQLLYVGTQHLRRGVATALVSRIQQLYDRPGSELGFGTRADNAAMRKIALKLEFESQVLCTYKYLKTM